MGHGNLLVTWPDGRGVEQAGSAHPDGGERPEELEHTPTDNYRDNHLNLARLIFS